MKKLVSVVLAMLMIMTVGLSALAAGEGTDVMDAPADWATDEVNLAIGENLIPEDMQNDYTKSVTREEFCILAIRMIEARSGMIIDDYLSAVGTEITPSDTFEDCDTKEVLAAKVLGITNGTSPTTFDPDRLLTRQEAAKFLTTTAMACGQDVTLSTPAYSDIDAIATWAQPYTGYVYDINVMKGVGDNQFDPTASYQRQQAIMTMYRIWKAIEAVNTDNVILPDQEEGDASTWFMGQNLSNPELADLLTVLSDTFVTAPFNLMMEDNNSMNIELNYMADESSFATTTTSERYNFNGELVEVIEFYDGTHFNTMVHDLETVQRYTNSVNDKKFFDFGTRTAYVGKEVNGTYVTFTFRDLGTPGVSGMSTYYDYDVNMAYNKLLEISVYLKESDDSLEEYSGMRYGFNDPYYGYSNMDQIPADYTVLGGGLFYDGESYPFWYVTEEEADASTWFMGQDLSNPELADLLMVLENTIETAPFNLMMEDNNGMNVELYYMADETSFATTTKSDRYNFNGDLVEVTEFYDGDQFITMVHALETVERYTNSVNDKKFFDFGTRTAYVGKEVDGTYVTFTFRDLGELDLSGLPRYYDYEVNIEYNKLLEISIYNKEGDDSPREDYGQRYGFNDPYYGYSNMDQIPEGYTVLEGGFFYDGESYPFWYVTE